MRTEAFIESLRRAEDATRTFSNVEIINVCLRKSDMKDYERDSLDRLLTHIHRSVMTVDPYAFLIFDEGREKMVVCLFGWPRNRNPMPNRYYASEDGKRAKDIPIDKVIGDPTLRGSHSDHLLQMAKLIACTLLKQEGAPGRGARLGIDRTFGRLDLSFHHRVSMRGRQSIVRRYFSRSRN